MRDILIGEITKNQTERENSILDEVCDGVFSIIGISKFARTQSRKPAVHDINIAPFFYTAKE